MTITVTYKEYQMERTYTGFWNGKTYNGAIYINGLNGGYVLNGKGDEINKKSIKLETKYITSKTILNDQNKETNKEPKLPTTVEGWMKAMERAEA